MKRLLRRLRKPVRRRSAERGVALILVMIFLALMLLLGLASTMTSITEVNVGGNLKLATEAFDVADAGSAHAFELVRNMSGDFTYLLRGPDGLLKSGDEFHENHHAISYKLDGTVLQDLPIDNFKSGAVNEIPQTTCHDGIERALVRIDSRHFYELLVYDNAHDPNAYIQNSNFEDLQDTLDDPSIDADQRALIRSIGYVMAQDVATREDFDLNLVASSAVVDTVVGLTPFPAIITDDDLTISNSVEIRGSLGSVHANDDLTLGSGNFVIEQSATFSNQTADMPPSGANQTTQNSHVQGFNGMSGALAIPDLNPFDMEELYIRKQADYIYIAPGAGANERTALLNAMGGDAVAKYNTVPSASTKAILMSNDRQAIPTYTVVASGNSLSTSVPKVPGSGGAATLDVRVQSNNSVSIQGIPPYVAGARGAVIFVLMPKGSNRTVSMNGGVNGQIWIMTNGSVLMNGNAKLKPSLTLVLANHPPWDRVDLLVMAGEDLQMSGTAGAGDLIEGVMYSHEGFDLTGSGYIAGQVVGYEHKLVWDAANNTYISATNASSETGTPVPLHGSIVHGNFEVYHNISRGYLGNFAQAAWRQLRDFDPRTNPRPAP